MKILNILFLTVFICCLISCSKEPYFLAQESVKSFLTNKLKKSDSYTSISFSRLDTLDTPRTNRNKQISVYKIDHIYSIVNSEKVAVKMAITFYLDKDLKVNESNTTSINGDYGIMTGNVFWKYNDYIGNRADAGAEVILFSLDTIRGDLKYSTVADLEGNYKIEKILPGSYFLVVRSNAATGCPLDHLNRLRVYNDYFKQLFKFDIEIHKTQLEEVDALDSLIRLENKNYPISGTLAQMLGSNDKIDALKKKRINIIESLFKVLPVSLKDKIRFHSIYNNEFDFSQIRIEEGKTENRVSDFGISCI